MQTSATAAKIRAEDKPKTQLFSLKTPYMKQGRVTQLVAETPNLWIHTKINAEGGENEIHKHLRPQTYSYGAVAIIAIYLRTASLEKTTTVKLVPGSGV